MRFFQTSCLQMFGTHNVWNTTLRMAFEHYIQLKIIGCFRSIEMPWKTDETKLRVMFRIKLMLMQESFQE